MNRTLVGRKIVRLAMLAGGNFDKFLENAADTCGVRSDILDDIFNSVVQKYKSVQVQIKSSEFDSVLDNSNDNMSAFASRVERLEGSGLGLGGLKGGLVKKKPSLSSSELQHTFQVPNASSTSTDNKPPPRESLLGLDKLAAQKKKENEESQRSVLRSFPSTGESDSFRNSNTNNDDG